MGRAAMCAGVVFLLSGGGACAVRDFATAGRGGPVSLVEGTGAALGTFESIFMDGTAEEGICGNPGGATGPVTLPADASGEGGDVCNEERAARDAAETRR